LLLLLFSLLFPTYLLLLLLSALFVIDFLRLLYLLLFLSASHSLSQIWKNLNASPPHLAVPSSSPLCQCLAEHIGFKSSVRRAVSEIDNPWPWVRRSVEAQHRTKPERAQA
ncbi:unnamed protein product, partial [Prunus brigantina]